MPSFNIQDSVAFVTGTNKPDGIGRAIVDSLLQHGAAKVYATARDTAQLKYLVDSHPTGKVVPVALDVTDLDAIARLGELYPDVTIVVNNAGYGGRNGTLHSMDTAMDEMKINYFAPLAMGQTFSKVFKKLTPTSEDVKPSAFVNINSTLGIIVIPMVGTYCASKAASHALTQAQRSDLSNSLVVGVYPGAVETNMTKGMPGDKGTTEKVGEEIMEALQNGTEDVFPDPTAIQFMEGFKADSKAMEHNLASMYPASN